MAQKNPMAQALARLRTGIKEKPSQRKKRAALKNLRKAWRVNRVNRKAA